MVTRKKSPAKKAAKKGAQKAAKKGAQRGAQKAAKKAAQSGAQRGAQSGARGISPGASVAADFDAPRADTSADVSPPAPRLLTEEQTKWAALEPTAKAAYAFWKQFLILRMGAANNQPLSAAADANFITIIRCVSWVESRHGTGTGNFPARDPVQCGNPADAWWRQVVAQGSPVPNRERFVTGPGGANYYAEELAAAVEAQGTFPAAAKLGHLANKANGHRDANFNSNTSFFWGVPFLIQKINKIPSGATYKCADASKTRMIDGAEKYNGGGVDDYRAQIEAAWTMIAGAPPDFDFLTSDLDLTAADLEVSDESWFRIALEITGDFETAGSPWSNVTNDFDQQGISCGVLQWNIGKGSLQPLVKAVGRDVVNRHMPNFGGELWDACHRTIPEGLSIVRAWQPAGSLRQAVLRELQSLFGSEEMIEQQIAAARDKGEKAMLLANKWAADSRGAGRCTLREFCWFFDLISQSGSLKGLWYADVEAFLAGHGAGAVDFICDWLAAPPPEEIHQKDGKKNAALWRGNVAPDQLPLFALSYLRAQKSDSPYHVLTMNRRGTISATRGWVNGDEEDLERLRADGARPGGGGGGGTASAAKVAKAEFKMTLAGTSSLISGTLALYAEGGAEVFSAAATSGQAGYQGPEDTWKRGQGPIPSVANLEVDTDGLYLENANIEGLAFKIHPLELTNQNGVTRGDFNIYQEIGLPGTPGGITLLGASDFARLSEVLAAAHAQGVTRLPLQVSYEVGPSTVSYKAARAVFRMRLRTSAALVTGSLHLYNDAGQQIFEAIATSGLPRYQTAEYFWTPRRGPMPPAGRFRVVTRKYNSEAIGGYAFYIQPERLVSPEGRRVRSAFRVHYDAGVPGSAGCIVIRDKNAFGQFCELMQEAHRGGTASIDLEVAYS